MLPCSLVTFSRMSHRGCGAGGVHVAARVPTRRAWGRGNAQAAARFSIRVLMDVAFIFTDSSSSGVVFSGVTVTRQRARQATIKVRVGTRGRDGHEMGAPAAVIAIKFGVNTIGPTLITSGWRLDDSDWPCVFAVWGIKWPSSELD